MVRNTDSAGCLTPWFQRADRSDDCLSAWCRKSFSALARKRALNDSLPSQIPKHWYWNDEWTHLKGKKKCGWDSACVTQCSPRYWCVKMASFSCLISAEEDCNNIDRRVNVRVCGSVCGVLVYMEPFFEPLSVYFFSNEGQKGDTLDLLNKPSAQRGCSRSSRSMWTTMTYMLLLLTESVFSNKVLPQ